MAAAGTGSAAEVLFSYSAGTGDRLVELKRPAFKGDEDIGRYVSWFRVNPHSAVERLAFVSWERPEGQPEVRTFGQGVLTSQTAGGAFHTSAGDEIALTLEDPAALDASIIQACLEAWPA
ncbi:unnamed protein product [Symbiodinium natans]|uniref:Uncharacterized protein n=1 Tax=Symbiodinium natans TaxID=878477 RepID=A0A812NDA5_9DINO|nr:unnamed protein product [Symbiodinium natans]